MEYFSKLTELFSGLIRIVEESAVSSASDITIPASTAPSVPHFASMTDELKIDYGSNEEAMLGQLNAKADIFTVPTDTYIADMTEIEKMEHSLQITSGFTPHSAAELASMTEGQKFLYALEIEEAFMKTAITYPMPDFASMTEEQHIDYMQKTSYLPPTSMYSYNYLKDLLIESLQRLEKIQYETIDENVINNRAKLVLILIYRVGMQRRIFTEEEKREFAELVIKTFKLIKKHVEYILLKYRRWLDGEFLIKRSALQFLLENYAHFPAGNSTLLSELQKANIMEIIEKFDNCIKWLCMSSDAYAELDDYEKRGTSTLPASHYWWPK